MRKLGGSKQKGDEKTRNGRRKRKAQGGMRRTQEDTGFTKRVLGIREKELRAGVEREEAMGETAIRIGAAIGVESGTENGSVTGEATEKATVSTVGNNGIERGIETETEKVQKASGLQTDIGKGTASCQRLEEVGIGTERREARGW